VGVSLIIDGGIRPDPTDITASETDSSDLCILEHPHNLGKGQALLTGMEHALSRGHTHALTLDADGQHPCSDIPLFLAAARQHPLALIAGSPLFGADAPWERVWARRLNNLIARAMTRGRFTSDSLFGMRVYPISPCLDFFKKFPLGRRLDFETASCIGLCASGLPCLDLPTPVLYPSKAEGGTSNYRYWSDNCQLIRCLIALRHYTSRTRGL